MRRAARAGLRTSDSEPQHFTCGRIERSLLEARSGEVLSPRHCTDVLAKPSRLMHSSACLSKLKGCSACFSLQQQSQQLMTRDHPHPVTVQPTVGRVLTSSLCC